MDRAGHIYQTFLDTVSDAVLAGDAAAVARRMAYPQTLKTNDGFLTVKTPDQMIAIVKDYHRFLLQLGTSDYHRVCDWAAMDADGGETTGEHMTYVVKGGSFALAPFRSRMVLRRVGDTWLGAGNEAEVSNRSCTILSPVQIRAAREVPE